MLGLSASGELSYNGITFDGASRITVSSEPVRDESEFTTLYRRYTITVQAVIARTGGSPSTGFGTDPDLQTLRAALAEDGRKLVFRNKGFGGDLIVNAGGPVFDLRKGPKPEVLEWKPIGDTNACEILWRVVTCVPECDGRNLRRSGTLSFNYDITWEIDEHGDTTRTISGYYEVVQARLSNKKLLDSADNYRNTLIVRPPDGFKRRQSFKLSKDKSRLDFSIVDTQIPSPNPYPAKVAMIRGTHSVSVSRARGGFELRRNIIDVQIDTAKGISGTEAWLIFLKLVRQRLRLAKQRSTMVLLDEVNVEEDLFGRACSFSIGYRTLGSLKDLVYQSGLWEPLDFKWKDWHESLKSIQSTRGTAGMFHNVYADVIVDLCGPQPTGLIEKTTFAEVKPKQERGTIENEKPPAEKSWIYYKTSVLPERDRPVIRHSILQDPEPGETLDILRSQSFNYGNPSGGENDVLQERGRGRYSARLVGMAMRAGHQIPRPSIQYLGQAVAVEKSSQFAVQTVGNFFGVPVYAAKWDILYYAQKSPGTIQPPPDLSTTG